MSNLVSIPGLEASKKVEGLCSGKTVDVSYIWLILRTDAIRVAEAESTLKHLLDDVVFAHEGLGSALAARLARRLAREDMSRADLELLFNQIFEAHPALVSEAARDMIACYERDPACVSPLEPLLFFKGFLALATYRVAHQLWLNDRRWLAFYLQSVMSEVFAVDIHPAAQIGCGILLDHATSFVVGETAIIENDVSILHEVTLGGTGKETGDRHPIVRSGVLLGAGAKILGRVEIGTGAKVGAGSVVLNDVPPHTTVAGVPAVIVGVAREEMPAVAMDQSLKCR
jgi:serine O-acetyltransferase